MRQFSSPAPIPVRIACAAALFAVWLAATAVLFWHFQGRFYLSAGQQMAQFNPAGIPGAPAGSGVRALYLLGGNCPCERGAGRHIAALQSRFGASVQQWVAVAAPTSVRLPATVARLDPSAALRWRDHVPAYPAAAIWDARGQLVYFGPLSDGPDCAGAGDSAVASTLQRVARAAVAPAAPRLAAGCLCPHARPLLAAN